MRLIDVAGTFAGAGAALLHFAPAGASFDLPPRIAYFAPFVILLAPALERTLPELRESAAARRLVSGLPWVGLLLAATQFPPGLFDAPWAQSWPFTPFTLALGLTIVVQAGRAIAHRDLRLAHAAAALAALATLGGDLPEIVSQAMFPAPWQAMAVAAVALGALIVFHRRVEGLLVHALAAFVGASALSQAGVSWVMAWIALLAWGPLILSLAGEPMRRVSQRATCAALATGIPVVLLLHAHDSRLRLVMAMLACAAAGAIAFVLHDRVIGRVAIGSAAVGLFGWPISLQVYGEVNAGTLLVEFGFFVLLAAFVNSLVGNRWRAREPNGADA